ncbi:MAG: MarR family transcriptional regulator [Phyllobacteriaceae bacterium]|nr:MarR family transcriptional regulator [Phyllobacteriaceae bacterium]
MHAGFSRRDSLGYLVYRLAHLLSRSLDARLAPFGVAIGQFRLLLVLWEKEDVTQAEIARLVGIEQPTVAITLKRMERDGLVSFQPDPNDARRSLTQLTAKGRALHGALTEEARKNNENAVKVLSVAESLQFISMARRMIDALEQPGSAD